MYVGVRISCFNGQKLGLVSVKRLVPLKTEYITSWYAE